MSKRDIQFLLDKYSHRRPGEKWSCESNTEYIREYRRKQKLFIFDGLNHDYKLTGAQKRRAQYLISNLEFKRYNNLSNDEIITMIALYVKTEYKPKTYANYKYMLESKGISEQTYITFLTGLNKNLASVQ